MPRMARVKSSEAVYHIMCRSISEVQLFKSDDDKIYYLNLIKKYKEECMCAVYAYCLMDNHLHIHFNPRGYDISTFMRRLNTAYVCYYNKKYQRHGHLFQDRFESKIISTDEYNLIVSAYIHNNPKDIEGYAGKEHLYPYSSYRIYLGLKEDTLGLIDQGLIRSLFNVGNKNSFIKVYNEFVTHQRDVGCLSKKNEKLSSAVEYEYRSGKATMLRDRQPSQVLSYISEKLLGTKESIKLIKSKYKATKFRSFCAYVMRVLCGLSYREICGNMYNITASACARLCSKGYELINQDEQYAGIFDELSTVKA